MQPPLPFTALNELRAVTEAFETEVRDLEADGSLEQAAAQLEWTGREVVAHLSGIYRWCAEVVSSGGKVVREPEGPLAGSATKWFAESRKILLEELSTHAPSEPAHTFQRDNRTVGFWHRRMLHETLIHLWDLRSIRDPHSPPPTEVSASVHADGVSEMFEAYAGRVDDDVRAQFSATLKLQATDVDRSWIVGHQFRLQDSADQPDATLSGPAGALLLLVWNRTKPSSGAFSTDGDARVVGAFAAAELHP